MLSEAEEASWRHLHPGSRVLLWDEGDTVWHERMLLAATCEDQSEWMMVTPDSDVHYESFRTDVSLVIVPPNVGVRPPLNDPVYGFADAIGMEAARGMIADGLNEAIRRGVELGATPREVHTGICYLCLCLRCCKLARMLIHSPGQCGRDSCDAARWIFVWPRP